MAGEHLLAPAPGRSTPHPCGRALEPPTPPFPESPPLTPAAAPARPAARPPPAPKPAVRVGAYQLRAASLLVYQSVLRGAVGEAFLGALAATQKYQVRLAGPGAGAHGAAAPRAARDQTGRPVEAS
jgi:hypothetical protein